MGIKGLSIDNEILFATVVPINNPPCNPGPPVAATTSISLNFFFAFLRALKIILSISFTCSLKAISGTTPP